jgi:hypothetical protein
MSYIVDKTGMGHPPDHFRDFPATYRTFVLRAVWRLLYDLPGFSVWSSSPKASLRAMSSTKLQSPALCSTVHTRLQKVLLLEGDFQVLSGSFEHI